MDLFLEQIERGSNQAQNAREQESCSDRFSCAKADNQHQGGDRKTSATDPGQPDSGGNEESDEEVHFSTCVEKVCIPHSSFVPPHRPDLGLLGSDGRAVQGWHPMLK